MTVDITKVDQGILEGAAMNLGWRANDFQDDYIPENDPIEPCLERLAQMSPRQVFACYCNWQGLMGHGHDLFDAVLSLQKAGE